MFSHNVNQASHSNLLRIKGIKVLDDIVKCGDSCIVMPPRTWFCSCRLFAPKHLWDLTVRAKVWKARIMIYYIMGNTVLQKFNSPLTSRAHESPRLEHIRNTVSWNSTICTAFNCPTKDRLPLLVWSFSSFPQNKHFGLESSDLDCLLFLGDWSFNVFFCLPSMAFWLVYWPRQVR